MISYITQKRVSDIMDRVATTPQDDVSYLTDQMMEEQPVILEYLFRLDNLPFGFDEAIEFDENEREYILYIGIVVWKVLSESARPTSTVTWDDLFAVIANFEKQFVKLVKQGPGTATEAASNSSKSIPNRNYSVLLPMRCVLDRTSLPFPPFGRSITQSSAWCFKLS